jgi:hypothetical protein
VTGWFSFLQGEATAGDVLALNRVRQVLDRLGVPYDVAWSSGFAPRALTLDDVRPADYQRLIFVCGPLHGPRLVELHERFAHCERIAVGTSVVDPRDPAVTGFHTLLARDGSARPPSRDLSLRAPRATPTPVVGLMLTEGQHEYGDRRRHAEVAATVTDWLATTGCAPVVLESRLDAADGRLCGSADELLSIIARLDVVLTDRLHGLVLALRVGVPPIAVDPVVGGAKVTAQARACGWPAVLPAERILSDGGTSRASGARGRASARYLDAWLVWCLGRGRRAAVERRAVLSSAPDAADELPAALFPNGVPGHSEQVP